MKDPSIFWFERSDLKSVFTRLRAEPGRKIPGSDPRHEVPSSHGASAPRRPSDPQGSPPIASGTDAALARQARALVSLLRGRQIGQGDFATVATSAAAAAVEGLGLERASVWLFEAASGWLKSVASSQRPGCDHEMPAYLPADQFPAFFAALASREPLVSEDVTLDPHTVELLVRSVVDPELCSFLAVPILQGDYLAGVLCAEHTRSSRLWTPDDEAFAAALASYLGVALAGFELRKLAAEHASLAGRLHLRTEEGPDSLKEPGHEDGHGEGEESEDGDAVRGTGSEDGGQGTETEIGDGRGSGDGSGEEGGAPG
jgi:hypothetical protein